MEKIKFLRSMVSGNTPSLLEAGELAINVADRTLFTSNDTGDVVELNEFKVRTKIVDIPANTWLTLFRTEGIADINVVLLDDTIGRRALIDFNFSNSYGGAMDLQVNNSFAHSNSDDNSIGNINGIRLVKKPTYYCYVQVKTSNAIRLEIKISSGRYITPGYNYLSVFNTEDIVDGSVVATYTRSDLVAIGSHTKPLMSEGELVYHRGDKPTKTDVGLSNVPNWTVSSATNDASDSKFATAGAVKKAYDLAAAALPKSGGEITGNLTISSNIILTNETAANDGGGIRAHGDSIDDGGLEFYVWDNKTESFLWNTYTDQLGTSAKTEYMRLDHTGLTVHQDLNVLGDVSLNVGEGLRITGDTDYWGPNEDARIIDILDQNNLDGFADGGLVIASYTITDSVRRDLLTLRDSTFKYKEFDIFHTGNKPVVGDITGACPVDTDIGAHNLLWAGQTTKGLYWGAVGTPLLNPDGTPNTDRLSGDSAYAFIRGNASIAGQLEIGSDERISIHETDTGDKVGEFDTNKGTLDMSGGFLRNGVNLDNIYLGTDFKSKVESPDGTHKVSLSDSPYEITYYEGANKKASLKLCGVEAARWIDKVKVAPSDDIYDLNDLDQSMEATLAGKWKNLPTSYIDGVEIMAQINVERRLYPAGSSLVQTLHIDRSTWIRYTTIDSGVYGKWVLVTSADTLRVDNNTGNFILKPEGGEYRTTGMSIVGALKLKLPQHKSNTMLSIRVTIFNYVTNTSETLDIYGYPYELGYWVNPTVVTNGAFERTIRLCVSETETYILISNVDTTWSYPQVTIESVAAGFKNTEPHKWATGWEVSFITTEPDSNTHVVQLTAYPPIRKNTNPVFYNGTSTTVTVSSDNGGQSTLNLMGSDQGSGVLYVGQSQYHGGGIEYNGDGTPTTTDYVGSDNVILYRRSAGVNYWTARCFHSSNDWYFRGNVYVNAGGTAAKVYSPNNKPTKTDVGLSNVPNYTFVDSVNDSSVDKFASAAAVKKAYDLAVTSHDLAANALPIFGGSLTGSLTLPVNDGIKWSANTDTASIIWHSSSDDDKDSRLEFQTSDNNSEYFRWTHKLSGSYVPVEWMRLDSVGLKIAERLFVGGEGSGTHKIGVSNALYGLEIVSGPFGGSSAAHKHSVAFDVVFDSDLLGEAGGIRSVDRTAYITGYERTWKFAYATQVYSDARIKSDIAVIDNALSTLTKLTGRTFNYNNDSNRTKKTYGFVAQEVKEVIPELVSVSGTDEYEDFHTLTETGIIPVIVEAVKELKSDYDLKIKNLEDQLETVVQHVERLNYILNIKD